MRILVKRTFLFVIAALQLSATICSCSREDDPEEQREEQEDKKVEDWENIDMNGDAIMESVSMRFSVGDSLHVVQEGTTRASTTVAGITTFSENDIVTISVASSYQDSVAKNYIVANDGTDLSFAGTPTTNEFHWESSAETVKLRAWSYGKGIATDQYNTAQASPHNVSYTLPDNQTSGYGELLYCAQEISYLTAKAQGGIALNMHHQLARIIVKLKRKAADDTSDIESVTIGDGSASIPTSATFVMPKSFSQQTGGWKDISKTAATITCHEDTPTSEDTAVGIVAIYSAVVIPDTYASGINLIQVTTKEDTQENKYNYTTTAETKFTAGNQYIFTITIGDDVATLEATYPTEWTESGFPITSYDTSKSFGVYVYNGSTPVYSNIEMAPKAAGSTVTLDAGSYRPHLSTSYTYYIYYPYTDSPGDVDAEATTAEAFFTGLMSSWSPAASQSTTESLRANDLQMGMISPTASNNRKNQTRTAAMTHKMGLARFTLATKTGVPTTIVYLNNALSTSSGSNTITASSSFSGFTPYNNSGTYLYLIRPVTNTSLNSTTGTDQWASALTYNIAAGSVETQEAKSKRYNQTATSSATWNYDYQGRGYTFSAPVAGTYKLECWGAQGGNVTTKWGTSQIGGYGGYSVGTVSLAADAKVFVYAGSQGHINTPENLWELRTFNGGGVASGAAGGNPGGGGATHMALEDGELKSLSGKIAKILIVAGGGGGGMGYNGNDNNVGRWSGDGGHGGGYLGNSGQYNASYYWLGSGGTQTSGGKTTPVTGASTENTYTSDRYQAIKSYHCGSFGQGGIDPDDCTEDFNPHSSNGGGGGGYYGGAASHYAGGAGGSGYIGNSLLSNKHMAGYGVATSSSASTKTISVSNVSSTPTADYAKQGAGYARISISF